MKYGILKSDVNTGLDDQILCGFVAPLSIVSNQPAYVQDMMNLKRSASSQNIQRWEIEANLEPSTNSADFMVHSIDNGYSGIFFLRMPQVYGLALTTAARTVVGVNSAGVDTIIISDTINKGEFIQFTGDTKVYLVKAGGTTITVSPPLLKPTTIGQTIKTGGNITMLARYDDSVKIGITYVDGILSDPGSIKFVEALQ